MALQKKIFILRRNLGGPYIVEHELSKEVPSGEAPGKAMAWSRSVWVSWTKNGWFVIEKGLNNWCPLSLVPDHTSIYLLIQSVVEFLETQAVMQLVSRSRSPGQILWINNSFFCVTCLFCRLVVESFTTSQSSSNQVHHSLYGRKKTTWNQPGTLPVLLI
jgi:hypothetical protein